jgi:hypothetical protein
VILLQRGTNAWGGIMRLLCGFQISVPRWVRTNSATTIRQRRNVIESYEAYGACLAVRLPLIAQAFASAIWPVLSTFIVAPSQKQKGSRARIEEMLDDREMGRKTGRA